MSESTESSQQSSTAVARRQLSEAERMAPTESPYSSIAAFEAAGSMSRALAQSTMVPEAYRNNPANCMVALELSVRTRSSVFAVMQNMHVIQGRPSWAATFLIGSINSSGRFSPLRYETVGDDPSVETFKCRAVARDLATGDVLVGEWITWAMVKAEGWLSKNGSKYKTMPGQMFRYRAASFWTRVFCPEISLGMHTSEEIDDIPDRGAPSAEAQGLTAALRGSAPVTAKVVPEGAQNSGENVPAREPGEESEDDLRAEEAAMVAEEERRGRR